MSLARQLGIRSPLFSFLEIAVFFALSAGAFLGLYAIPPLLGRYVPVWGWILAGAGYLLTVTVYWAPGDSEDNEAELRGFVLFLLVAAGVGGVLLEMGSGALSGAGRTFWSVLGAGK